MVGTQWYRYPFLIPAVAPFEIRPFIDQDNLGVFLEQGYRNFQYNICIRVERHDQCFSDTQLATLLEDVD